jgi:hypothetical protein
MCEAVLHLNRGEGVTDGKKFSEILSYLGGQYRSVLRLFI